MEGKDAKSITKRYKVDNHDKHDKKRKKDASKEAKGIANKQARKKTKGGVHKG